MGISIHYKGEIKDTTLVYSVVDELKDISEIMNWNFTIIDNNWDKPLSAELTTHENRTEITGHIPLKGILMNLHPNCEPLSVMFDRNGNLQSIYGMIVNQQENNKPDSYYLSVKTQFAPPETHIAIVKLLKYLKKKYIPDLEVLDEGSYWETGDKDLLTQKISFINKKIDQIEEIILSTKNDLYSLSPDERISFLEKILRDRLK